MNVLFIGGGRRVSLAERFVFEGFHVFSYETEVNCPITKIATVIQGLKWHDPVIKVDILNQIKEHNIELVIPLQDAATKIIAELGLNSPTSSVESNSICLNKDQFAKFCMCDELIDYYPFVDENYGVIKKPIQGFNSKGISVISFDEYLKIFKYNQDDGHIYQKYIPTKYEVSVDCYFNKSGILVDAVPRHRTEVQGGEVSKSVTLDKNIYNIYDITKLIGEKLKIRGPACFQYIVENNKPWIMEINGRFGGGAILSLEAGFKIIDLIKKEYVDTESIDNYKSEWKSGLKMTRYFKEYFY